MLDRLAEQPRKKMLLIGLGGVVAALAVANLYLARSAVDISPVAGSGPATAGVNKTGAAPLKTPLDTRPVGSFAETVARPIFNAARKPVDRQQPQAAPPAGPDALRLVGILQTAAGAKRALIRSGADAKGQWLVEGGAVSGWTVKSIGQRSVIVMSGGRDYEIAISKGSTTR